MFAIYLFENSISYLFYNETFNVLALVFFSFLGLENVALHKIAWQKYPLGDNELSALLAIDGRKANLSHWGRQCVASRYGRTAEWRVDLKGLYSIHHIVILYVQYQRVWGI